MKARPHFHCLLARGLDDLGYVFIYRDNMHAGSTRLGTSHLKPYVGTPQVPTQEWLSNLQNQFAGALYDMLVQVAEVNAMVANESDILPIRIEASVEIWGNGYLVATVSGNDGGEDLVRFYDRTRNLLTFH